MAFEKGQPRHPNAGRKKGTPNKKKLVKAADVLAEKDINPVQKILEIIEEKDQAKALSPYVKAQLWLDLLSYCQAKPKETEPDGDPDGGDQDDFDEIPTDNILEIYRKAKGTA